MSRLPALFASSAVLIATSIFGTPAADAASYGCGSTAPDHDQSYYGRYFTGSEIPIHNGPYGECKVISYGYLSDVLDYHCYTRNSYGNTWTYLRDPTRAVYGWVWDNYLSNGGSGITCP